MNVDIARQLNEIPPTWVVEQLARTYGEEIWDRTLFMNIGVRGVSFYPDEKVVVLVCAFCNKHYLEAEPEPGQLEKMPKVEVARRHFRNRINHEVHVFWVGQCEGCGTIYWGQE